MEKRRIGRHLLASLCGLMLSLTVSANPFLQKIEKATPANRIIYLLSYFDTCQKPSRNIRIRRSDRCTPSMIWGEKYRTSNCAATVGF